MKGKGLLRLNYESQIRISLVFFILFLILLNFGTEYLFHQTKRALKDQIHQHLSVVALSAGLIWEKSPKNELKKNLLELSFDSGVHRISFLSLDGEPLMSSKEVYSTQDHHIFRGVQPDVVTSLHTMKDNLDLGKFFSDFYQDNSGKAYLSCYLPLQGKKVENRIWIMVEQDVSGFSSIESMAALNLLARIIGILIAAFVTLLLIRNLLRPYRTMIKKAKIEELFPTADGQRTGGELDAAVGIFEQVISELKKKEKTLQELYHRTDRKAKNLASYNEYILRSMTSGMIICDDQGKIRRMNHPAQMILDVSEDRALGKHYTMVFQRGNPLRIAIGTTLSEQKVLTVPEVQLTKRGGEIVYLALSSSTVKDDEGRILGAVVLITDLTEMKKLEQEITFKDKMATLGEMSSGLAHELRNSMGAILGFVKLLKKNKANPVPQNQTVDIIYNEAMNMEAILQRFLSFAKPYHLKIEKVDLARKIEECQSSLRESLNQNRIEFALHSEIDVVPILGDSLLLKQSFQNLMQNSIEAMPDGGKLTINLRTGKSASGKQTIEIEFSDTGCGILTDIKDKIFNPFFSSRDKGTGLGLSLVKKIIGLHNGRIDVDSQPGKWTKFTIHLPLKLKPQAGEKKLWGEDKPEDFVSTASKSRVPNSQVI